MLTEKVIKDLLTENEAIKRLQVLEEKIEIVSQNLALICSVIAVRQKDACQAAGVAQATAINKRKRGRIKVLQADGGRATYLTLQTTKSLKERV